MHCRRVTLQARPGRGSVRNDTNSSEAMTSMKLVISRSELLFGFQLTAVVVSRPVPRTLAE
jgi:hypothetical protein